MTNRQKAIQKILKKLKRVLGLKLEFVRLQEQYELETMIIKAIETDWEL